MFRVSLNRARLQLRIDTLSPLRIGAGDMPLDPSAADLVPVRTRHAQHGLTVFVPGASLKGALRSSAEARLRDRSLRMAAVCDPLRSACAIPLQRRRLPGPELHRQLCPCCRLFGSSALRGRAAVRDHFPWPEPGSASPDGGRANAGRANRLELRHRVAIDRRSGAVGAGPFDAELVPAGVAFHGEIALENYQVWQLGLLVSALDDLNDGFAQLGAGRSEGLGQVAVEIEGIVHEQAGAADRPPAGVGALARPEDAQSYGLMPELELPASAGETRGLAARYLVRERGELDAWIEASRSALGALA